MNPYQPPFAKDEPPLPEGLLMQVRYSKAYTAFMTAVAMLMPLPNAILAFVNASSFKPLLAVVPTSLFLLWFAWLTSRTVFFDVFEDRLEFLSLGLKWRRIKKPLTQRVARWVANREDFARFQAWREARSVQ